MLNDGYLRITYNAPKSHNIYWEIISIMFSSSFSHLKMFSMIDVVQVTCGRPSKLTSSLEESFSLRVKQYIILNTQIF